MKKNARMMAAPIAVYVQTGTELEIGPEGSPGKHKEKAAVAARPYLELATVPEQRSAARVPRELLLSGQQTAVRHSPCWYRVSEPPLYLSEQEEAQQCPMLPEFGD